MASFNVSLEDSSPLISYAPVGAWTDSPENDPLVQSYSASSFHTTSVPSATATITFNGTGIWVFGAQRPDYGSYTLAIDGQTTSNGDANAQTPTFRQALAGASNLPMGTHTAVVTNTGSGTGLDIDNIIFETEIGSSGQTVSNQTIDDAAPQITYSDTDWSANTGETYIDNTLHFTQNGGATASITFSGEAVAIYGTVSPDHSDFSVAIDGNTATSSAGGGGMARVLHAQTLLYFANGLGPGEHNLVLTADPEQSGQSDTGTFMDLDAMTVYSATGSAGDSGDSQKQPATNDPSSASAQGGLSSKTVAIIAGVASGVFILLAVAIGLFFTWRRHVRRKRSRMPLQSPGSPELPMQRPTPAMVEAGFGNAGNVTRPFPTPILPSTQPLARYGSTSGQSIRSSGSRESYAGSERSVQSYGSGSLLLDPPPKGRIPRKPPPTARGAGGSGSVRLSDYNEVSAVLLLSDSEQPELNDTLQAAPVRPLRPPDLQLSLVPL
ncbi:hypothetical protein OE88DRAFT_1733160 [Heliocybe sulcata]|uniref:Transmembrane protein n=1 Tax=Heliocybe sulcata TaxID=5364 RepID=A0A5C3N9K3_9AGAM|nr:hypothetical protein OE88DRAFT_1733160 [Heliocybe sulcata]